MGYSRTWTGSFRIEPPVAEEHASAFERLIAETAHLGRCGWVLSAGRVFLAGDATSLEARPRGWLEWDGGEKFAAGQEWLEVLVSAFFAPRHYSLTGQVTWEGEEPGDTGELSVVGEVVTSKREQEATPELDDDERARWVSLLQVPDVAQRLEALDVLSSSDTPSPGLVTIVARVLLTDTSERVRLAAAELLRDLGPAAKTAEPALISALDDTTDFVAAAAAEALGLLCEGPAVIAALEAANRSASWTLRFRATEALERLKR